MVVGHLSSNAILQRLAMETLMIEKDNGPHGVGGWLALLVAGMVVMGPLLGIGGTLGEFAAAERQYPALAQVAAWSSFKTVQWIAVLIFCAISVYGGLGLATKRTPDAVTKAKLVLWFNYPISVVVTAMIVPATMLPGSGKVAAMAIPSLVASLIAVAIWTAYLNRSKRVKNTYGLREELPIAQVPATADQVSRTNNLASTSAATTDGGKHATTLRLTGGMNAAPPANDYEATVDEDHIFSAIADELDSPRLQKGLWTKLFAQCDGDERRTKVLYIKVRADQIRNEENARISAFAEAQARLLATATDAEAAAIGQAPARCPNCNALIGANAVGCTRCGALFENDAAWAPIPCRFGRCPTCSEILEIESTSCPKCHRSFTAGTTNGLTPI